MELVFAIVLGTLFGFVLQRVGAADPTKIIGMLRLSDLHLMKAIFLGIGISSALLFAGISFGIIDAGHLSIKSAYWGVILGGLLLGFGWAISGYCPGTGIVAAGSGRTDGWFFIVGGLVGALAFTVSYGSLKDGALFGKLFGGKAMLVQGSDVNVLIDTGWSPWLAVLIGLGMIAVANFLPAAFRKFE